MHAWQIPVLLLLSTEVHFSGVVYGQQHVRTPPKPHKRSLSPTKRAKTWPFYWNLAPTYSPEREPQTVHAKNDRTDEVTICQGKGETESRTPTQSAQIFKQKKSKCSRSLARWVAFFLFLWVRKKLQHYSLGGPDLIIRRIFVGINPTKWVETRCCQVLCCAVPHNLKPPCWPMYKQGNICSQRGGRAVRSDDSTPELKISAISAGFLCAGFSTHAGLLVIPSLPPWYDASPA
jgi:hypothetical protein